MNNFIVRTITSVLFVAVLVSSFLNPLAMVLLFTLISAMSVREFCTLINNNVEKVQVNTFISTIAGAYLFLSMAAYCSGYSPSATVFVPYLVTVIYLLVSELYLKAEKPIDNWAYTMMSQMYVALPLSMINVLAFQQTSGGVQGCFTLQTLNPSVIFCAIVPLSVFIFLWLNDAGAYCVGSLIGKHKLFPRISPGKSWEGSIGGGCLVVVAAIGLWYITENTRILDALSFAPYHLSLPAWIGMGLVVVVFGTWGDLIESLLKRTLGIKDSGNVLPGHGGMLDRFDSTILAMPAVTVYLYTISMITN
ncbi:MAG: phosphatidate cytidylyltransferase [Bacteroidaceae bacterium]|nr:phosphatidate cytidylyltransferase [Bacteroidaceae bacterium]